MAGDLPVPVVYWNLLPQDDRSEYIRLRTSFHHAQKISSKDRRVVTFRRELTIVIQFLERSPENLEARCIVTGVCFAGGIVCVNTRQLKGFLKRCKSSINGSFQQLGYVALRTKSKARNCVLTVLPSLQHDQNILRQWTVRAVSDDAEFCFLSSFSGAGLPEITDRDLLEDRPLSKNIVPSDQLPQPTCPALPQPTRHVTFALGRPAIRPPAPQPRALPRAPAVPQPRVPRVSLGPKMLTEDLPIATDFESSGTMVNPFRAPISSSYSVDCFREIEIGWSPAPLQPIIAEDPAKKTAELRMKKSKSLGEFDDDWADIFGFGF
jgi:hypothetical protein